MWWILLVLITALVYQLIRRQYSQWERLGLPYEKPNIPFGNLLPVQRQEKSFFQVLLDLYNQSKEKLLGIYLLFQPAILLRDAKVIRQIMTTDFASFHDRGVYVDEKRDPLTATLFTLKGQSWRSLRTKLTPAFSSGKLKGMFGTIDDVGDKLVQELNKRLEGQQRVPIELKNLLTTFAIDIIGSVIFGLDVDSFSNPDNEFRMLSTTLFEKANALQKLRRVANFICPPIVALLTFFGIYDPVSHSIRDLIQRTIEFREKHQVVRKDMLQVLIQLRNTGKISDDDDKNWNIQATEGENLKSMSIDMIGAQAFVFYIAGSEATASTASYTLYELAMYPELLQRAENDVVNCMIKHGLKPTDQLTYEALQDMQFLDLCIKETLRKYPGLPFLNRECTQDFQVPDTNYTIKKGTAIIISLVGLHRDAKYFPEPMKYDPDRFAPENPNFDPIAYMPFGEGPRHCIAARMGHLSAKVAVAKFLANFNLEPVAHEEVEFKFDVAPLLVPLNGLNIYISKKNV